MLALQGELSSHQIDTAIDKTESNVPQRAKHMYKVALEIKRKNELLSKLFWIIGLPFREELRQIPT